jgi:hypothetical protein
MFTDERERLMLEHSPSIQAWGWQLKAESDQPPLITRMLLSVGETMVALGTSLVERFGSVDDQDSCRISPRNHAHSL